jgi:diguanylate cyclase (GGDEF)-like protein
MLTARDAAMPPPHGVRPFRLIRFFSLTSLIGIVVVTACLFWTYRELTVRHLVEHEGRANADLTRAFANSVWGRYRGFVLDSPGRSRDALLADPAMAPLRAEVSAKMSGLQVAKIKIYNLAGMTVFSTDDKQIGEDKSSNAGFREARAGAVASNITFRERFDAFEGVINNRNLITSYVPVRAAPGAPVEGVFEVYSDVTDLLHTQTRAQWQVAAIVLALLSTLYVFLFLVVRKADRVIARQEQERAAKEEQVRHQAYHDMLTGLPNRAYFSERLGETIALASRHKYVSALMFIDLDRFKIVNDSLGHQAGDVLLQQISGRIQACLRESDLLFRMGGDEFTIILPRVASPEDAAFVARRIQQAVISPVSVYEHELTVGATIGIAVYPGDGDTAEALLKNADAAMYSAKEHGRGSHAFYRSEMNQRASQRLDLEVALKRAFRDGEFTLYYQPRLDAATQDVVALEALLRWISPSRGVVPPGEFIGVLEDTGMMTIVGEWVLRSACAQVCRWRGEGMAPLRVSVNVSSLQFQCASFVAMVQRVLRETGAPPELIELELTESLLIANAEQASATIKALKALGLRISIDDFGTGYSSLNYLRHFAVDYLKIDRSFVTHIASNERDRAVVVAIIELAKALDITVVAEGVETEAQAAFFTGAHCHELQGFLFCKPLPVEGLQRYLARAAQGRSALHAGAWDSTRGPMVASTSGALL